MKISVQLASTIMLLIFTHLAYADDPRFSRVLEFALMNSCVGESLSRNKEEKIKRCACALEKTQENGFWPDYDKDEEYHEDRKQFMEEFNENIHHFSDMEVSCPTK